MHPASISWFLVPFSWFLLLPACAAPPSPAPPTSLLIATGGPGGAYYPLGQELSHIYAERVAGIRPSIEPGTSGQNVRRVEEGTAQVAFTQADVAYTAYRRGTEDAPHPFSELRGIAVLWVNTVHIAVPRASRLRAVTDLRGRRVAVGTRGSGTETLARIVLESYGLGYGDVQPDFASFVRTVETMRAGEADAGFVVAGMPADAMADLARDPGVRLLPVPADHVQVMSTSTGLPSRSATARPSASVGCQPSFTISSTLEATAPASTQRLENNS